MMRNVRSALAHKEGDRGSALIAVIGVMVVVGVMVTVIVASTSFNVRTTTSTRGGVQAQAAAEAGIDAAQAQIFAALQAGPPPGDVVAGCVVPGLDPVFSVKVATSDVELSDPWAAPATPGCGVTATTKFFYLRSEGTAAAATVGGSGKETRVTSARLFRDASSSPSGGGGSFNAALFGNAVDLNEEFNIVGADADVVAYEANNDKWLVCKNKTPGVSTDGSLYALGQGHLSDTCHIGQNVYVDDKLESASGHIVIDGNLYVHKGARLNSDSVTVHGDVIIADNLAANTKLVVDGTLWVGGNITGGYAGSSAGAVNYVGTNSSSTLGGTQILATAFPGTVGAPAFPKAADIVESTFPELRMTDPRWAGFTSAAVPSAGECNAESVTNRTITVDTKVDATSCGNYKPNGTYNLQGHDLVIFAKAFEFRTTDSVTVTGPGNLYFVVPLDLPNPGSISWTPDDWTQSADVAILFYATNEVLLKPDVDTITFHGQAYAKKKVILTDGLNFVFKSTGLSVPGGGDGGGVLTPDSDFTLDYVRDGQ